MVYVATMIYVQNMGLKLIIDSDTAKAIIYSLDMPTMLVLIIFAGLCFRQELTKPKYNIPKKNRWMIDAILSCIGVAAMGILLLIKYVM
ncbi:hypothetical protein [Methanocella arvoryzae]|uniref:hypothetical protein n=1 Tax=Methanocella arvoryzae TaxID=1175445 RepID=UPI000326981F|nr:hypothetical protein [Methanocella arvoryzae]